MKKYTTLIISLLLAFGLCSCASQPLAPPELTYEEKAVKIHVTADPQLNLSAGRPHTLLVCVYQLRDPNAFNQFTGDQDGLYQLLECKPFDASVAASKKLFVQPETEMTYNLDRGQGVRYVGVVAGYYLLDKDKMVRLYDIPVVMEKKGFSGTKKQKLNILKVDLNLGPQRID